MLNLRPAMERVQYSNFRAIDKLKFNCPDSTLMFVFTYFYLGQLTYRVNFGVGLLS